MRFNVVVAHYRKPCKVHQIVIPDKHEQSAQRSEGTFYASAKDPESVFFVDFAGFKFQYFQYHIYIMEHFYP